MEKYCGTNNSKHLLSWIDDLMSRKPKLRQRAIIDVVHLCIYPAENNILY